MNQEDVGLISNFADIMHLGVAAREFLSSPIGIYMVERADEEVKKASKELVNANPMDPVLIATIQSRIKVPEKAILWILDAIHNGNFAESQLDIIKGDEIG